MIRPTKPSLVKILYRMALARKADGSWSSSEEVARWYLDAAAIIELDLPSRWNSG